MKPKTSPAFFDDEDSDSSMEITLLYSESDDDSEAYTDAWSTFSVSSDDEGNRHINLAVAHDVTDDIEPLVQELQGVSIWDQTQYIVTTVISTVVTPDWYKQSQLSSITTHSDTGQRLLILLTMILEHRLEQSKNASTAVEDLSSM